MVNFLYPLRGLEFLTRCKPVCPPFMAIVVGAGIGQLRPGRFVPQKVFRCFQINLAERTVRLENPCIVIRGNLQPLIFHRVPENKSFWETERITEGFIRPAGVANTDINVPAVAVARENGIERPTAAQAERRFGGVRAEPCAVNGPGIQQFKLGIKSDLIHNIAPLYQFSNSTGFFR